MSHLEVIVLGCGGGPFEHNLSGYLLIDKKHQEGICLDAGTLLSGLQRANFEGDYLKSILENTIKAYLISHPHLDHIAALVMASQSDTPNKGIYGTEITINALKNHVFNGIIWADLSSKYNYVKLNLKEKTPIANTSFTIETFPLNHAKTLPSTAFLIENAGEHVLYFGDTSSDFVENEKKNQVIWQRVAPLIKEKKLKTLFLECSFPNKTGPLYGHLSPELLHKELETLQSLAGPLTSLKVIVTHIKSSLDNTHPREAIIKELTENNTFGVHFLFPEQGQRIPI